MNLWEDVNDDHIDILHFFNQQFNREFIKKN